MDECVLVRTKFTRYPMDECVLVRRNSHVTPHVRARVRFEDRFVFSRDDGENTTLRFGQDCAGGFRFTPLSIFR